jgi:hypothetical protein
MASDKPKHNWWQRRTDSQILWAVGLAISIVIAGWMSYCDWNDIGSDRKYFAASRKDEQRRDAAIRCVAEEMEQARRSPTADCRAVSTGSKP